MIPTKPVKSQYKYLIISKSCKGRDITNIDRYRITSSVILLKISKFISIDICIDFQLSAHVFATVFGQWAATCTGDYCTEVVAHAPGGLAFKAVRSYR